jgi:hypothetical protein
VNLFQRPSSIRCMGFSITEMYLSKANQNNQVFQVGLLVILFTELFLYTTLPSSSRKSTFIWIVIWVFDIEVPREELHRHQSNKIKTQKPGIWERNSVLGKPPPAVFWFQDGTFFIHCADRKHCTNSRKGIEIKNTVGWMVSIRSFRISKTSSSI